MNLLRLENQYLAISIAPEFGGKVLSLIDRADGHQLLFQHPHPAGPQRTPLYGVPYPEGWYAAWDECFPGIAPSPYPHHPYQGITVPDHGELWALPAKASITPNAITTFYRGVRFAYDLQRSLQLDGPRLHAHYTLHNPSAFPLHFVWAQHALLSCESPFELDPTPWAARESHDATGADIQKHFTFPHLRDLDLSKPAALPRNKGWKIFSQDPIPRPMVIRYPHRKRALTIGYSSPDLPAVWGIWTNTGAWANHHHVAVEATIGRYDQVDRAVADGKSGLCPAYATLRWSTTWSFAPLES